MQLQAINEKDKNDIAWCFVDVESIQALVPGFGMRGTYIVSACGLQTHVSESPREIMAMIEKL